MTTATRRDNARWKAAAIHLLASLALVGGALLAPMWLWYRDVPWSLAGINRPLLVLFAAVLLVGPLLTLLVYRTGKRSLRMDLCVVVAIQLAFLGYAATMLGRLRPVFLVAAGDRLELVRAVDIAREDLASAPPAMRALSWTGPRQVGLATPGGFDAHTLLHERQSGDDFARRPAYYVGYAQVAPGVLLRSVSLEDLKERSAANRAVVSKAVAALGRRADQLRAIPIISAAGSATMLIDAQDATPLRTLDLPF
jgi:hypothetical protein